MAWNDGTNIWYYSGATTATSGNVITTAATSATTNGTTYTYFYTLVVKTIYVEMPENWTDEDCESWAVMVNATQTGAKVKAIIRGKICIMDPNAEIRSMVNFIPLLKSLADAADRKSIDDFMAAHPIVSAP